MSTYVLGDCHGAHLALQQCLDRCNFNPVNDTLISLGDICDGWPHVKECVEILQAIPKFQGVIGNHDVWAMEWASTGNILHEWRTQGGEATLESFGREPLNFPQSFFKQFHITLEINGKVFVHGGLDVNQRDLSKQHFNVCTWDRSLVNIARRHHNSRPNYKYGGWDEIYVGHTTTQFYHSLKPLHYCNVWMVDTGAGWSGKLTIMDVDTKEYWQSDLVPTLYPHIKGR